MPYFVTDQHPACDNWAVVKEGGELVACHDTQDSAVDQMVAASLGENLEPGGTYEGDTFRATRDLPDNYRPALEEDVPEGRACGNCFFYQEDMVSQDGTRAWCARWEEYVEGDHYCNAWQEDSETRAEPGELAIGDFVRWDAGTGQAQGDIERIVTDGQINVPDSSFTIQGTDEDPAALIRIWREGEEGWEPTDTLVGHRFSTLTKIDSLRGMVAVRQVDLDPPAYMRAAARQGLRYFEEGLAGDGLQDSTVREARAMARGNVTAEKWVRIAAWIARHLADLDAPAADPSNEDYPSPGVVAHLLWGSGPSKRGAERALAYAVGVVDRLEAENEDRATGEALAKLETRTSPSGFEIRETSEGMTFEGYAALFDSPSEPLPFTERIAPGAFTRSLKSRNDIKMLWNHSTSEVLGSTRANTLRLTEDDRGLKVWAMLPNTTTGRDAAELIRRGDVDSMSFGFSIPRGGDSWSTDGSERTLKEVRLHEVSVVAFPAYEATAGTTSVRGLDRLAHRAEVDADALADALLKVEMGDDITSGDKDLLERVLAKLAPEDEEEKQSDTDLQMLQLKKKKLELLMGL
jgi:HK97 family phage prohead protease